MLVQNYQFQLLQFALVQWRSDLNKKKRRKSHSKIETCDESYCEEPSFVSSSTSVSLGKRYYGKKILGSPLLQKIDQGNLKEKQRASLQQIIQ